MKYLLIAAFTISSAMATSIGLVDMKKVLFTTKEGQKIKTQLEKTLSSKREELRKIEDKVKKERANLAKQAKLLSADARSKKEAAVQKMFMDLQQKSVQFQNEIRGMEQKLTQPIIKKVYGVVETVSKAQKLDLTFDALTAPIIYAKTKKDITADVIKAYDKAHPAK